MVFLSLSGIFVDLCVFTQVLVKLLCNPHSYTDKAASLVQEAAYLQANLSGQDGDAVSIPISHIDGEALLQLV